MAIITIREQSTIDTGFDATLVIEGNNYSITVTDPFQGKEEQELEWYFEQWLRYPLLENVKANRAKDNITQYGENLFQQIFESNVKAYAKYSQLRNNLSQLQIEIESIFPEFHALHWEALKDLNYPALSP